MTPPAHPLPTSRRPRPWRRLPSLPASALAPVLLLLLLLLPLALSAGCAAAPANRSFAVTVPDARRALSEMRAEPKPLERPLVVLSGFGDPGFAATNLRARFRQVTGDDRVIGVSFLFCGDFAACRNEVIGAVDRAFPSDDPTWTAEVDVVAVSMGGLVARYAAVPSPDASRPRRLRIARLFTISTPHRGAAWAALPALTRLHSDMRADSPFLSALAAAEAAEAADAAGTTTDAAAGGPGAAAAAAAPDAGYEIVPYVRLDDAMVGAVNAAPYGRSPWWVPGELFQPPHLMASSDARIIADVARRLRGETPLTTDPPEPLPTRPGGPPAPPPPPRPEAQHASAAPSSGA